MNKVSEQLDSLACELIGAAIERLEEAPSLDLWQNESFPVLLACDCEEEFLSFENDTPDECYAAACAYVAKLGEKCQAYALVYEGAVQESLDEQTQAALVVEFAERNMACAWSGYMYYRYAEDGHVEITDPLPAGEEELLFAAEKQKPQASQMIGNNNYSRQQ